jgi:uncharacterized protein DUF2846
MLRQVVVLSIVAIVISGCATARNGPDFTSLSQKIGPPKPGQARIVVFRERRHGALDDIAAGWPVMLDGEPFGSLKNGTYVYADRPTGRHQLQCDWDLFPGVTRQDLTLAAGRTYFFHARLSERAKTLMAAQAFGGLAGFAVGAAVTSGDGNSGPLDFALLDEAAATAAMSEVQLAE